MSTIYCKGRDTGLVFVNHPEGNKAFPDGYVNIFSDESLYPMIRGGRLKAQCRPEALIASARAVHAQMNLHVFQDGYRPKPGEWSADMFRDDNYWCYGLDSLPAQIMMLTNDSYPCFNNLAY